VDSVYTPKGTVRVWVVVKSSRTIAYRFGPPTIDLPVSGSQQQACSIKSKAQVHAVSHVDKPPRTVLELLTAYSCGQRVVLTLERKNEISKALMDIEGILINIGAWPADAAGLLAGYKLSEETKVRP